MSYPYDDVNPSEEVSPGQWRPVSGKRRGTFVRFETSGESISGIWLGYGSGPFGPVGQLETRHGVRTFGLATALRDELDKIAEGTLVRIRFTGWRTSKAGRRYRHFEVDVADGA